MSRSPASGQADRSVHGLAPDGLQSGVQPHGLLLVVQEPLLRIVQASTSAAAMLRRPLDTLLLATLNDLGGDLDARLRVLLAGGPLEPAPVLHCRVGDGAQGLLFEGAVHRAPSGALVVELEPLAAAAATPAAVDHPSATLLAHLAEAVQRFGEAGSVIALAAAAARWVRALVGYDRVVVSELGADGRNHVIAEALDPALTPLLGPDDPVIDASALAREVMLRQRLRVLVDVDAVPASLLPELPPGQGGTSVLLHSQLRCTSPAQAQLLRSHGVAAAAVAAVVCDGQLWGLITCHHGRPRNLRHGTRAAIELLAEAFATRVLALQNYARAQALAEVQRLEQRLLDATSTDGDWQGALLRNPAVLLQPLAASGALLCHEGQTLGCGQLPAGAARQALLQWVRAQPGGSAPVHCAALDETHPARRAGACGVLAVRLSQTQPDCLLWVRPEHAQTGSALPWTGSDVSMAAAIGATLVDTMLQVNAVRLLIAESHLARVRAAVAGSQEAVVVADATRQACYANVAFQQLAGLRRDELPGLDALAALFTEPEIAHRVIGQVRAEQRAWRGELSLRRADGSTLPVAVRAEPVPAGEHTLLGTIFIFEDLSAARRADAARARLDAALARTRRDVHLAPGQELLGALLANAGLAAMDITEGGAPAAVPPLLAEVEASTTRAAALLERIHHLGRDGDA